MKVSVSVWFFKLFCLFCDLRWLTWDCSSTLALISVTCGTFWTSLWSAELWWPLPARKSSFPYYSSRALNVMDFKDGHHNMLKQRWSRIAVFLADVTLSPLSIRLGAPAPVFRSHKQLHCVHPIIPRKLSGFCAPRGYLANMTMSNSSFIVT